VKIGVGREAVKKALSEDPKLLAEIEKAVRLAAKEGVPAAVVSADDESEE
jgi:hypothetical protein